MNRRVRSPSGPPNSELRTPMLRKIISGGQTGADRAGLDFAIEAGFKHGGSVPRGRIAEDGVISQKYRVIELPSESYEVRTRQNVRDSDGTVVFTLGPVAVGGTKLTIDYATEIGKPLLRIYRGEVPKHPEVLIKAASQLRQFIETNHIENLNVAGSRESVESGIYTFTLDVLRAFQREKRELGGGNRGCGDGFTTEAQRHEGESK
jgi:Circularly permutated YpsA SLOG family